MVTNTSAKGVERIMWKEWAASKTVQDHHELANAKAACITAIKAMYLAMRSTPVAIDMVRDAGKVTCTAEEQFEVGTLRIMLPLWNVQSLLRESNNPNAIAITYKDTSLDSRVLASHTFQAIPDISLPKLKPDASGQHDWTPNNNADLFWAIRRSHESTQWNCELQDLVVNHVTVGKFNACQHVAVTEPLSRSVSVTVPFITNTRKIMKGDAVVLRVEEPVNNGPHKKAAAKRTWVDEERGGQRKDKQRKMTS